MAENKRFYWIKLKTDFFNLDEIDFLLSQKNGCEYIVLYQMLCLKTANNDGRLCSSIGEMLIRYDVEKIVRETKHFDSDTVIVALELFKKLGLIFEQEDGILKISAISEMVGSETSSAKRVREYRERKALQCNTNVTQEIEYRDKSKELDIDEDKEQRERIDYQQIADMYNEICISFPRCTTLSDNRKKSIKARLKTYSVDDFKNLFTLAEQSDFLKGKNERNWNANFDWLIKDSNFAKVLDGNYNNKINQPKQPKQDVYDIDRKFGTVL